MALQLCQMSSLILWRKPSFHIFKKTLVTMSNIDCVRTITLSDTKTRNALSLKMLEALRKEFSAAQNDQTTRCVILTAQGPVFSSGHNLKELTSKEGKEQHQRIFATCSALMQQIMVLPVPVIAKVQGVAAAAGCQLVATCDIIVAAENAQFLTPGANFGIFCSTPGIAVARAVPRKVAAYMLLTGLSLDAQEALRAGLVSHVVPEDQLDKKVDKVVQSIKANSRSVIALGKKFFYQQIQQDIASAYRSGEEVMVDNLSLKDGQEGIQSFIEKRKPKWSHDTSKV